MTKNLESRATQGKGRRITIDLTPKASKTIGGLRKLANGSTPDLFRYSLSVGAKVISAYETGGKVYIEDKS